MAKPGSRAARAIANGGGAVDLNTRVAVPEEMAVQVRAGSEAQLGLRCGGCGKRIGVGLQFTRIDAVRDETGRPAAEVLKLSACNGADGCDFATQARDGADVVEMVEYVWLSGEPPVGGELSLEDAVARAQGAARDPGVVGDPG